MLNKRGNLMKLVSLYEKWDRRWNSLGECHSLPSSDYLSPGFPAPVLQNEQENTSRGKEERDR